MATLRAATAASRAVARAAGPSPRRTGLLLALALAALGTGAARADESERPEAPLMVRDTNAARFALEAARDAVERGDGPRAAREVASLLGPLRDDLVLLERRNEQTRWISAPEAAAQVLESMPPSVFRVWAETAEAAARPALEAAGERRDEAGLRSVLARHPGSPAALSAARLLAESAIEAGRFPDAAAAAAQGLRFAPGDAALWIRRVDALGAAGDARALAALTAGPKTPATATAGGARVSLSERVEAARRAARRGAAAEGWPVWGGNASHDRAFPVAPAMRPLRWSVGEALSERGSDDGPQLFRGGGLIPDRSDRRFDALWPAYAPFFPALAARVLYVSDGRTVSAHDLYSGRARWTFPDGAGDYGIVQPAAGLGRTNLATAYAPCVEGGRVFATVEVERPYAPRYLNQIEYTTYIPRRVLVALDAATGRPLWRMGEHPADAAFFGDASAAGPPVAAEGLVVVPVVRYGGGSRVWVVAFDAATGRPAWQRYLVNSSQELNLFGEPVKELFSGAVAIEGGTVYAGTGLGIVAALETRTGAVRWMSSYETIPIERVEHWYTTPLRFPVWGPAPPQVHGDALIVAAPDTLYLHVFDRDTGELRWREEAQASETYSNTFDHLLGVATVGGVEGVVTTGSSVHVYDLANGKRLAYAPLASPVLGRGALTAGGAFVPTGAGLARFSIGRGLSTDGVDPWPPGAGPGNVLSFPGVLVVASRGRFDGEDSEDSPARRPLQGFFAWEEVERELNRRREASPADASVLLELADVMRVSNQWTRARSTYEEAARVARGTKDPALAERARDGLHRVQLERGDVEALAGRLDAARDAYEASLAPASRAEQRVAARLRLDRVLDSLGDDEGRLANLEALAGEDGDLRAPADLFEGDVPVRAWARVEAARLHEQAGRAEAAVDAYQAILREDRGALLPAGTAREVAKRAIDRLVRASPEAYRRHEQAARALLEQARAESDEGPIERLLAEYPNAAAVADALLDMAREAVAAIRRLLESHAGHPVEPAALATLARALARTGAIESARAALGRLERLHADATFSVDGEETTGARFAAAERARLPSLPPGPGVAPLEPPLAEVARVDLEDESRIRLLTVKGAERSLRDVPALVSIGHEVVAVDPRDGRVRFRHPIGTLPYAAVAEDVLVLASGDALVGLDPGTGDAPWRLTLEGVALDLEPVEGQVAVLTADRRRTRFHVALVDPVEGRVLWGRDLGSDQHLHLMGAEDHLLVRRLGSRELGSSRQAVVLLSLLDGSSRGEIPLPARSFVMPRLADPKTLVVAGRDDEGDFVEAWDVPAATRRWRAGLATAGQLSSPLLATATEVVAVDRNGTVTRLSIADGSSLGRVTLGEGVGLQAGSAALLDGTRVVAVLQGRSGPQVGSFDVATGKAAWTAPVALATDVPSALTLEKAGDVIVLAVVRFQRQTPPAADVTLYRASDGSRLQTIEEGSASAGTSGIRVHGGSLFVTSRSTVSVWRGRR